MCSGSGEGMKLSVVGLANIGMKNGPRLPIDQTLNLTSNRIGDEGVKVLAASLRHVMGLKTLELRHNGFSDQGWQCLIDAVARLIGR